MINDKLILKVIDKAHSWTHHNTVVRDTTGFINTVLPDELRRDLYREMAIMTPKGESDVRMMIGAAIAE